MEGNGREKEWSGTEWSGMKCVEGSGVKGRRKDGRKGRKGNPSQGTHTIEPKSNEQ